MRQNLMKLGMSIKSARKNKGYTLRILADKTELTPGLLSKIENFRTIPSLPVLIKIAEALSMPTSQLLEGIDGDAKADRILVKASMRESVEREESSGFHYEHLLDIESSCENLQVSLLTIMPGGERQKVTTKGDQFIFILSGTINFILGSESIAMDEGDLLFFNGDIEHVPKNSGTVPAALLAAYLIH